MVMTKRSNQSGGVGGEPPLGNPSSANGILASTIAGVRSWLDKNIFEFVANKGQANGYAPLDASAKVPAANLPEQTGGGGSSGGAGVVAKIASGVIPAGTVGPVEIVSGLDPSESCDYELCIEVAPGGENDCIALYPDTAPDPAQWLSHSQFYGDSWSEACIGIVAAGGVANRIKIQISPSGQISYMHGEVVLWSIGGNIDRDFKGSAITLSGGHGGISSFTMAMALSGVFTANISWVLYKVAK
jgi:hypothetical protein